MSELIGAGVETVSTSEDGQATRKKIQSRYTANTGATVSEAVEAAVEAHVSRFKSAVEAGYSQETMDPVRADARGNIPAIMSGMLPRRVAACRYQDEDQASTGSDMTVTSFMQTEDNSIGMKVSFRPPHSANATEFIDLVRKNWDIPISMARLDDAEGDTAQDDEPAPTTTGQKTTILGDVRPATMTRNGFFAKWHMPTA